MKCRLMSSINKLLLTWAIKEPYQANNLKLLVNNYLPAVIASAISTMYYSELY
ncbi:MAG: hypothetical protein ACTS73_01240 [Arsenophonus sp. NEOnobi-MAG3]